MTFTASVTRTIPGCWSRGRHLMSEPNKTTRALHYSNGCALTLQLRSATSLLLTFSRARHTSIRAGFNNPYTGGKSHPTPLRRSASPNHGPQNGYSPYRCTTAKGSPPTVIPTNLYPPKRGCSFNEVQNARRAKPHAAISFPAFIPIPIISIHPPALSSNVKYAFW